MSTSGFYQTRRLIYVRRIPTKAAETTTNAAEITDAEVTVAEANRHSMRVNTDEHYAIPSNKPGLTYTGTGCDEV